MATMTVNQYRGFLGETAMAGTLLSFGMSVNSLSSSDFGLDIHVQLPEDGRFAETEPWEHEDPWEMSGRTAHFQVKTVRDKNTPSVSLQTLRNWVKGSVLGAPTFILISHLKDSDSPKTPDKYVTPTGLRLLLDRSTEGSATRAISYNDPAVGYPFHRRSFYARLELWTLAPAFMYAVEERIPFPDTYGWGRPLDQPFQDEMQEFDNRVITLLVDMGHSYLSLFHPGDAANPGRMKELVRELADGYEGRARNGGKPSGVWASDEGTLMKIESAIASRIPSVPRIPPGSFTSSACPEQARKDLQDLVTALSEYQPRVKGKSRLH